MELVNIWHSVFVFGVMLGRLVAGRSKTSLCGDPRIFRVSFSKADGFNCFSQLRNAAGGANGSITLSIVRLCTNVHGWAQLAPLLLSPPIYPNKILCSCATGCTAGTLAQRRTPSGNGGIRTDKKTPTRKTTDDLASHLLWIS